MDLSKLAEHVRTTHFAIIVVCVTILIIAQANQDSQPYDAYNELLIVERLASDWKPNDLERIALGAYSDHYGQLPPLRTHGTVTLYPNEANNGIFNSAPEELGYPTSEEFSASAISLLSDTLLAAWHDLASETLSSDKYAPPSIFANEEIEDGPYYFRPHSQVFLQRPSSLSNFSDFWNVLALDHSLQTIDDGQSSLTGVFSMTKYIQFAFGDAYLEFHSQNCGLDDIETETSGDCLWMFAGGLQNGRDGYGSLRQTIDAFVENTAEIAGHPQKPSILKRPDVFQP